VNYERIVSIEWADCLFEKKENGMLLWSVLARFSAVLLEFFGVLSWWKSCARKKGREGVLFSVK